MVKQFTWSKCNHKFLLLKLLHHRENDLMLALLEAMGIDQVTQWEVLREHSQILRILLLVPHLVRCSRIYSSRWDKHKQTKLQDKVEHNLHSIQWQCLGAWAWICRICNNNSHRTKLAHPQHKLPKPKANPNLQLQANPCKVRHSKESTLTWIGRVQMVRQLQLSLSRLICQTMSDPNLVSK